MPSPTPNSPGVLLLAPRVLTPTPANSILPQLTSGEKQLSQLGSRPALAPEEAGLLFQHHCHVYSDGTIRNLFRTWQSTGHFYPIICLILTESSGPGIFVPILQTQRGAAQGQQQETMSKSKAQIHLMPEIKFNPSCWAVRIDRGWTRPLLLQLWSALEHFPRGLVCAGKFEKHWLK